MGMRIKALLKRIIYLPVKSKCDWHRGDYPVNYDDEYGVPYCPECGRLIWTSRCDRCGKWFMAWGETGGDDVMAAPAITESGDFMCEPCARGWEEEEGEEFEEDYYYDYEEDYLNA
jgi:predicted RNA-binding Zn-ribbon protein involved in translation (DUF1610 family)